MPTLLAVDDSATMRKVLEITFSGTDFQVTAVGTADAALEKVKGHAPDLVLADGNLDGKSGYDLCKAIKQAAPSTRVLILSSKHNPYDTAKGTAAQADDHMDKPFDTQQMIDRVKQLMGAPAAAPAAKAAAAAPNPAATLPLGMSSPAAAKPAAAQQLPSAAPLKSAQPAQPAQPAAPAMERSRTLAYAAPVAPGATGVQQPAGGAARVPAPAAAQPAAAKPAAAAAAHAPAAHAPAAHAPAITLGPEMQKQLEAVGLTPAQVDAVLALSREVVERVVWEVVPVLAETLIKEELARLTK